jgi:acyl carrier protein
MNPATSDIENQLLSILTAQLTEMGAERALRRVSIQAKFEYDLGLDSLDRVEFIHRVEEAFDIEFPPSVYAEVSSISDVMRLMQSTQPSQKERRVEFVSTPRSASTKPAEGKTLIESLLNRVEQDPMRPHIYFQEEDGSESIITYGHLYDTAIEVAKGLAERGLKPLETVAIMLPTSTDFFYAYFGILLAGGVPVPIYPPFRPNQIEEYVQREAIILRNAGVRFLITFPQAETLSHIIQGFIPSMKAVVTVASLRSTKGFLSTPTMLANDPALIQYTSGSTGNPKGVLLTHANLLANLTAVGEAMRVTPDDRVVSWLPLYHDMGLIGCWFGSLHFGLPLTILSPLTFLSRPERWLWAIHAHRATISASPNFGYELCIRKLKDSDIEGLDLSSWRLAFNGAEPVRADTLRRFSERFKAYGFNPGSPYPVYGLAESTVAVSFPPLGRKEPLTERILREPLETQGSAIKANADDQDALEFVSCGKPIPGHDVRIVDDKGSELPQRTVGALWFRGPSSMEGYYNNPDATKAIRHEDWYDSGDFAYMADGEIYITGRKKDMIIKAGRNIYPQDLEEMANRVAGVRKGCVIAFGTSNGSQGTDTLVIVAETVERSKQGREDIEQRINQEVVDHLGMPPDEIILVSPGTIPKTSSGKLQRSACKAAYEKNQLTSHRLPFWAQVAKLYAVSFLKKVTSALGYVGRIFYTAYVGVMFFIIAIPILLGLLISSQSLAQRLTRFWGRCFFALVGWRIKIEGAEFLTSHKPMIFVSNHASYLDGLILAVMLPTGVAQVGKEELVNNAFLRWVFKKLDHLTVSRQDLSQSLMDLSKMEERLKKGQSLALFPEGTFTYVAGLRMFKLGAFKLAVDTETNICPLALHGTRHILPDQTILMRPSKIKITVSPPLKPQSTEWNEVLRLRTIARELIAKDCGEPVFDVE